MKKKIAFIGELIAAIPVAILIILFLLIDHPYDFFKDLFICMKIFIEDIWIDLMGLLEK